MRKLIFTYYRKRKNNLVQIFLNLEEICVIVESLLAVEL